ncbi:Y-family DNA polymerase [Acidiphilium iwatense]|uniref:DNA-directed DNA polymerase n=1 Tax=Acidiphilium iwatense TaxID=768198 RepID=A0ABS9E2C2_9PROT|nr:Y-family DNA polymerase [Acidiphilium iwatense]MCF3948190.1 Y-family DNA polymerase [Acidiphilium iwatense]
MPVFGLIDGNSFYCSAERAFAPELRGKPLVVLSNNDGCAIARTPEAKACGIGMGEPWHLIKNRPECRAVLWRSSNYSLYGDMSRRVYDVLTERVPQVEPYSIDEMFLDLAGLPNLESFCRRLRDEVRQVTKIPTCIGIGPTKTIAKLANRIAKNRAEMGGVCDLRDAHDRRRHYQDLTAGDVWGIGSKAAAKLATAGTVTIADFIAMEPRAVRDLLTVTGARVQAELRGLSCLPLSLMAPTRQGIAVTRTFGRPVETWAEIREAVATYTTRAAEKLRAEGLEAGHMAVFAHTSPHNDDPWHSAQRGSVIEPTADTAALIGEAVRLLQAGWRPGYRYFKAGVMLTALAPVARQASLFATRDPARSALAMEALDAVNARWGHGTLRPASTGIVRPWGARQQRLSPRYTTRADEMMIGQAF